jgi:hypothetical protein
MNDVNIPTPSQDTLNFSIFLKNVIVFPCFQLERSNIEHDKSYLKKDYYDPVDHSTCPIFLIDTLLDIVEPDPNEQRLMLQYVNWCNLFDYISI